MSGRRGRPARLKSGALSEDAWSDQVAGLASFYGWLGYHTHRSDRSAAGFPDWTFLRVDVAAELLLVELKPDRKADGSTSRRATIADVELRPEWLRDRDVTNEQAEWLEAFRGLEGHVASMVKYLASRSVVPFVAVEAHLWRPADFDAVHRRLAAGRGLQPVDWAR